MRGFWLLSKKLRGGASSVAAPLAMAAVIAAWAALAAVGWALLYLPHLPAGFSYSNGIPRQADFAEALYISLVALSTAGFGEIVAVQGETLRSSITEMTRARYVGEQGHDACGPRTAAGQGTHI